MESIYSRTRKDHSTELAEDYVEAIADFIEQQGQCRAVDLVSHFAVTHATVNNTIARLVRDDLATTQPYQPIELTAKGRKLAAHCKRRHEIVESFLLAMGVDASTAAVDSEGMEHHVSRKTLDAMKRIMELGLLKNQTKPTPSR
jgi:DtxR family manganese transport transcriptional regulator